MTKWKTRSIYVDIDTGEKIEPKQIHNYTIIKNDKHTSIQNGWGTIEITNECRRIYTNDLFNMDKPANH